MFCRLCTYHCIYILPQHLTFATIFFSFYLISFFMISMKKKAFYAFIFLLIFSLFLICIHMKSMLDDFFWFMVFCPSFSTIYMFLFFFFGSKLLYILVQAICTYIFFAPSWYDYRDLWWLISNLCQTGKPRTRTLHFTFVFFVLVVVLVAFLTVFPPLNISYMTTE